MDKVKSFKEYKKKKKNSNKSKVIKTIFLFIFIASIGIGNLCIYQVSTELKYDIYYLEKDLNKRKIKLEGLEVKNLQKNDLNKLEKEASSKLNMIYPNDYQKRYISKD